MQLPERTRKVSIHYPVRVACSCCQELSSPPVPDANRVLGIQPHGGQTLRRNNKSSEQQIKPKSFCCSSQDYVHKWIFPHVTWLWTTLQKQRDSHSTFTHWREHWNVSSSLKGQVIDFRPPKFHVQFLPWNIWGACFRCTPLAFWFINLIIKVKGK